MMRTRVIAGVSFGAMAALALAFARFTDSFIVVMSSDGNAFIEVTTVLVIPAAALCGAAAGPRIAGAKRRIGALLLAIAVFFGAYVLAGMFGAGLVVPAPALEMVGIIPAVFFMQMLASLAIPLFGVAGAGVIMWQRQNGKNTQQTPGAESAQA